MAESFAIQNQMDYGYTGYVSGYDQLSGSTLAGGTTSGSLMSAINPRHQNAFMGEMHSLSNNYESKDIMNRDAGTLEPMIKALGEYRVFGKKYMEKDRLTKMLDYGVQQDGAHKTLAAIQLYTAKEGGLKNGHGSMDFTNLSDPGLLVRQTKSIALTAPGAHNKNIEKLTDIAIKAHSPQFAAALIAEAGKGLGVNDKTVKAILVDSKEQMNEVAYNKFIADTSNAYEQMTGKSMDKFIRTQYSKASILGIGFTSIFGANQKGSQYLDIIDNSRQNTHGLGTQHIPIF